jgi:hypothetical protein
MKQTVLGILTAATLAFTLPAAGEDIRGWHEAKWGMTTDEVQKVLSQPTHAVDLAKVCHEPCSEGAAVELDGFEINGQYFVVRFWFSKLDERLQAVSMYAKHLDDANGNEAFTKIKGFLEASYGKPGSIAMKHGDFVISWTQQSTTITLFSNATNYVTIVYEERSDHEGGKP